MPKGLKYTLIGLGGFLVFALIMVLAMNLIDQKLKPEVKAILDKPYAPTETQMNAYFYFLGAIASEEPGAEARGRILWEKRKELGFWDSLHKIDPFVTAATPGCKDPCTPAAVKDDPKLSQALQEQARNLQIYIKLIEYGEGATPREEGDFRMPSALPYAGHKLLMIQMAEWLAKGGQLRVADMILASNRYAGSFIRNGSLLERVIGTVILRGNARFVIGNLKAYPKFPITHELVESFNFPRTEDILFGAMDEELRTVNRMTHMIKSVSDIKNLALGDQPELGEKGGIPASVLFRPNETLNRYYDISSQMLTSDCASMSIADCVPAFRWTEFRYPWNYLRNPVGRALVRVTLVGMQGMRLKLEDRRADIIAAQDSMRLSL